MDRDRERSRHKRPSDAGDYDKPYKKQRMDNARGNSSGKHHLHHGSGQKQNGYSSSHKQQSSFSSKQRSGPIIQQSSLPLKTLEVKDLPPLPPIAEKYESLVFTHPSLGTQELEGAPMMCYDKLEFLGDAYIEIIATRQLWNLSGTKLIAARMSSIREGMVKNETLSEYAIAYGLDKKLNIPEASRPLRRDGQIKINGDVFEAYVAAVVLSKPDDESESGQGNLVGGPGYSTAEKWLTALWVATGKVRDISTIDDVESKGILQRRVGGKGVLLSYSEERERIVHKGKGVEQYFVGVYLDGWGYENQHLGSGEGPSKKAAGMAAAKDALERNVSLIEHVEKEKAKAKREREEYEAKHGQNGDEGGGGDV